MKQNKLILFDWGNIVEAHTTGYNLYTAYEKLAKDIGYTEKKQFTKTLSEYGWSVIQNYEEFEKMFNKLKKEYNLTCSYNEFLEKLDKYFEDVEYYENVRDYERSLKEKCYIGVLSNLGIVERARIDKQLGLDNYDYVFLSFEIGLKKPNNDIYEYVEEHVTFKPENILFIDDREDNIMVAKKRGWNTLQATGLEFNKIKKACEDFLDKE